LDEGLATTHSILATRLTPVHAGGCDGVCSPAIDAQPCGLKPADAFMVHKRPLCPLNSGSSPEIRIAVRMMCFRHANQFRVQTCTMGVLSAGLGLDAERRIVEIRRKNDNSTKVLADGQPSFQAQRLIQCRRWRRETSSGSAPVLCLRSQNPFVLVHHALMDGRHQTAKHVNAIGGQQTQCPQDRSGSWASTRERISPVLTFQFPLSSELAPVLNQLPTTSKLISRSLPTHPASRR